MRIGLLGGTFDPIHFGHLLMAEQALEQAGLDQIWFLPAAHPPHKPELKTSSFERRIDLINLAIAGYPKFQICLIEQELPAPSYTINTLDALTDKYPVHQWSLILGGDSIVDLPKWHQPRAIVKRVDLLAIQRPGFPNIDQERLRANLGLIDQDKLRLLPIQMPLIEISSRDLRSRVEQDRSIRFMVPAAVEVYIRERRMYKLSSK
jgi:nicotinate-nucleotide adenylyltransferase